MEKKTLFTIGKVTGVHGLKGYLKVYSFAESISTFAHGLKVFIKDINDPNGNLYEILNSFPYKKGLALLLKGVINRNIGKTFIGKEILINRDDLPEINEENTWFWEDLIGLCVLDLKLGYIGKIDSIIATGSNDVFIVKNNKKERLVPCIASVVRKVDIYNNEMKVELPEGL